MLIGKRVLICALFFPIGFFLPKKRRITHNPKLRPFIIPDLRKMFHIFIFTKLRKFTAIGPA